MDEKELDMSEEAKKEIDVDDLTNNVKTLADTGQKYIEAVLQQKRANVEYGKLTSIIKGDVQLIEHKLDAYASMEELSKALNDPETLKDFFINDDGSGITIVTDKPLSKKEEIDVKKSLLMLMKTSKLDQTEISCLIDKFQEETSSIEDDMKKTASEIVLDTLRYALDVKNSGRYDQEDEKYRKKIDAVLSGFDFNSIIKSLHEHSTIIPHTLDDMKRQDKIVQYGKRYRSVLKHEYCSATLITFISNSPETSFEKMYLPPDKYQPYRENLFLFSIIRHFAMTYWTTDVRKTHAMLVSLLQQLVEDKLPDDIREQFLDNIANYLKEFN